MNEDKGICAEIPISQITGKKNGLKLSNHGNAVLDAQDNVVCKICQPLEFVISGADKLTLNVVGRTNKNLAQQIGSSQSLKQNKSQSHLTKSGKSGKKKKPYQPNKSNYKSNNKNGKKHSKTRKTSYDKNDSDFYLDDKEFGFDE